MAENDSRISESFSENTPFKWSDVCLALRAEDIPSSDKMVSGLVQLGLSKDQAKVYISGSRLGKASAKAISKECSLDLSTTYSRLKELARVGLFEIELGTPNIFIARCPDSFLEKCKSGLIEQVQIVDQIGSEIAALQTMRSAVSGQKREPSYRFFLNRTLHFNASLKYWRESKHEVLQIAPSRLVSRMTNERLEILKESHKNGVSWRWITEIKESNMNDVKLLAKYSRVKNCPKLSFSLAIFDRTTVFFCGNPSFVSSPENANETHFTFDDAAIAQAFVVLFESLWQTSADFAPALPSIKTMQSGHRALEDL